MPELPEVQTTVNDLLKLDLVGQSVKQVKITWPAAAGFMSNHRLTHYPDRDPGGVNKVVELGYGTRSRRTSLSKTIIIN